ncbi:hypothetical protein SAMN05216191_11321 [Paenibacillus jilunlii]|uniref:Uncharacterized protein n=1 Tax=Paenibacillus jilunlii TaxID=682956 RepID=A0A1G9TF13_9BACL|nr:hypothetical protein SAMN05216191_11321 [Paenibacillus jilunlii]
MIFWQDALVQVTEKAANHLRAAFSFLNHLSFWDLNNNLVMVAAVIFGGFNFHSRTRNHIYGLTNCIKSETNILRVGNPF